MPRTTDDLISDFVDDGFDYETALELAEMSIAFYREIREIERIDINLLQAELDREFEIEQALEGVNEDFNRLFRVGCRFEGVKEIAEYEDDEIFIPSSYYCAIKCFEKFFEETFEGINIPFKIETKCLNPFGDSLRKIRTVIEELAPLEAVPSFFKKVGDTFVTTDKKASNKVGYSILLIRIKKAFYHAVLVKADKITLYHYKKIVENIKIIVNKKLSDEQSKMTLPKIKKHDSSFYVYDIETSSKEIEEKRFQIPEGLGFMKIEKGEPCKKRDVETCVGKNCYQEMLDYICENDDDDEIKIFAHNGGRFDNIFVKGVRGVVIKEQIKTGGCVRKLEIEYEGKRFIFLDSCSFLQASLKSCCKFFNTEMKDDFDIVNKSHEWFKHNTEWVRYMKQDVYVLGQIMEKFESYLNILGESVTTTIGIASIAWRIMCKSCFGLTKMYISKNPVAQKFIKDSCYGGRILHFRKKFIANETIINGVTSKGLISLDGNSLYPSAMYIGCYPIGKYKVLPNLTVNKFMSNYLEKERLCIVEVEIDSKNSRYPLIPYRTDKGSLIYRSGKFVGVYNSVDLLEAINDGMEIVNIIRGIYWEQSGRIFHNLIENFYNKRAQFKAEKNGMEYVLKIALNSMYGKFLEEIDSCYKYEEKNIKGNDDVREVIHLKNGQKEYNVKMDHSIIKKPTQVASFILSYARKIMNNVIRQIKPENVFYSDTDSVYVPIETIGDIKTSNELCGFKNDYGEGVLITKAYFVDIKRYYMEFSKPVEGCEFKAKFNGLNFKNKQTLENWFSKNNPSIKNATEKMYKWFYKNPGVLSDIGIVQERWTRLHDSVYISEKEMKFQINPDTRNDWDEDIAYPLHFKKNEEFIGLGRITKFETGRKIDYLLSPYGMKSALPIICDELEVKEKNYISIQPEMFPKEFKNSYVVDISGKCYLRTYKKVKEEYEEEFYEINEYGPIKKVDLLPETTELIVLNRKNCMFAKIDKKELEKILLKISMFAKKI